MSAQASKAAKELTEKLFDQMPVMFRIQRKERVAGIIQSALADLLTQVQYTVEAGPNEVSECQHFLAAALEPWKAGE